MSNSSVASGAIVFTLRPPWMTPTFIVVRGSTPTSGMSDSIAVIARARSAIAFGRPYAPHECPPSVVTEMAPPVYSS